MPNQALDPRAPGRFVRGSLKGPENIVKGPAKRAQWSYSVGEVNGGCLSPNIQFKFWKNFKLTSVRTTAQGVLYVHHEA